MKIVPTSKLPDLHPRRPGTATGPRTDPRWTAVLDIIESDPAQSVVLEPDEHPAASPKSAAKSLHLAAKHRNMTVTVQELVDSEHPPGTIRVWDRESYIAAVNKAAKKQAP